MTEKPVKVRYTSRSLERHVLAPRDHTWKALIEAIAERGVAGRNPDGVALHETVLSLEPPWRRSARIEGDMPLEFYEGTFVLRDDGDECHLAWGIVVDPEPTDEGWRFLDEVMEFVGAFMDHVVDRAAGAVDDLGKGE